MTEILIRIPTEVLDVFRVLAWVFMVLYGTRVVLEIVQFIQRWRLGKIAKEFKELKKELGR